ncbi:hypothetical protein PSTT_14242 [Puccinia striiformis]|uniref:Uncharacterized protein n=1 Tax=Puccinia striiformis TaxID=27350 RepID=A0A2S4UN58_9BASI|nr:hypothetical protein PSTT_14242 [Puccinia striiformis]
MSSDPEAEKRGLPNLNKAQILEDLECLSKNRDFERQLSSKTPTTKQSLEEFSLTQVQLPLPSDRPQQPQNLSDAVNSASSNCFISIISSLREGPKSNSGK